MTTNPHTCPAPRQHGDDIMSRWRRSVDELAARRRQHGECERAQEALGRVTSCFQQLAVSLGSSADSSFLRDEMDETRALAHRICSGTKTCPHQTLVHLTSCHFLTCLSACRSVPASDAPAVWLWLGTVYGRRQTGVGAAVGSLPVRNRKLPVWPPQGLQSDWTVSSDPALQ